MFKPKLSCPRCDQSEKISSLFSSDVRNQLADRKEPLNYVQGVDWSCLHQSILATTPTKIEQIYWRRSWPLTAELKVTFVSGEKAFWLRSVWVYITLHPENWETFSLSFKFSSLAVVVNFQVPLPKWTFCWYINTTLSLADSLSGSQPAPAVLMTVYVYNVN